MLHFQTQEEKYAVFVHNLELDTVELFSFIDSDSDEIVGDAFVFLSDERIYLAINHEYDGEAWYVFSSFELENLTTPLVSMYSYQGDNTIQQFAGSEIGVGGDFYSNFISCSTDNANFATEGIVIEIQTSK